VCVQPLDELFQIDTIQPRLALVPPRPIELKQRVARVQFVGVVIGEILVECFGELVVPTFGNFALKMA